MGFILSRRKDFISFNYIDMFYGNKIDILTKITLVCVFVALTKSNDATPQIVPRIFYFLCGACHSPLESSPMFTILHEREEEGAYCGGHVTFGAHSLQASHVWSPSIVLYSL